MPKVFMNINSAQYLAGSLARPDYQPGNYLLPDDLTTGQNYLRQRLRRHNRMLHGAGVVCGMNIAPANDPTHPWGVYVCPGYAIGPYGDEIVLLKQELVDISQFLWTYFGTLSQPAAYVGISYKEESVKPVLAPTMECQCDEPSYMPSRVRDSYEFSVLWGLPDVKRPTYDFCSGGSGPCEECPSDPNLLLALIQLPASAGDAIVAANIMNLY